ncbi:hypothetical protein Mycch_2664 [Mycolicibacterium chubuense NBB4]|uniref:DNA repair protein RadA n=1 Tax=Mycolicibacterium chubuense (strain NBB4) TaxID=710421 RepID=I4BJH4_MYCCN|nr:AAA family ATPase [Mycolicibacterium chubuense]AFM17431.1 hypothetical protein Mycch_2664 [Mycolicibacterium chubuense NBB4]
MTDTERSWQPIDLTDLLSGEYAPPKPVVGQRSDGVGLFYPGKVHTIASESEAGKTWLALAAAFDEIKAGNHVLYIDFEDNEQGIVGRLLAFQLEPELIGEFFHYIKPMQSVNSQQNLADLTETVVTHQPILVIIDGVTEAMTVHGLKPNLNEEIALFSEMLPRKLSRMGCAVVCLDHVVKSLDGRGRYAIGGVHKLNGLDGAAYILESREPISIGVTGRSDILIAKDRPGQLRRHGIRRKDGLCHFADLTIESHDESYAEFEIRPAVSYVGEFRPTHLMEKISRVYEERPGKALSQRTVLDIVGGKRATAQLAHSLLRADGYLTEKTPHTLIRPYRADPDTDEIRPSQDAPDDDVL